MNQCKSQFLLPSIIALTIYNPYRSYSQQQENYSSYPQTYFPHPNRSTFFNPMQNRPIRLFRIEMILPLKQFGQAFSAHDPPIQCLMFRRPTTPLSQQPGFFFRELPEISFLQQQNQFLTILYKTHNLFYIELHFILKTNKSSKKMNDSYNFLPLFSTFRLNKDEINSKTRD